MAISCLKIYNGADILEMPKVRYTISAEEVAEESTMLSGKIVKDILGCRTIIEAEWEWIPAETLSALIKLVRTGKFYEVEYQDIDGATKKEPFQFSQPELEIFTFTKDGTAVWTKASLTMTAQEVSKDA